MKTKAIDHSAAPQPAIILHPLDPRAQAARPAETRLLEAAGLAAALDLDVRQARVAPLRTATPATLFGKGKVAEIEELCRLEDARIVVVDGALTPIQQRNLERAWNVKVIDRTGLILEIFGRRARTREGRLQVELARLDYERSRLVRTWTHLERQRGGFGFLGGPGETQIEADRRLLLDRIVRLKSELREVRRTRTLQRGARERAPCPTIALVGYTNAGKSTLFNRLTHSEVMAKDMLFATLDPTLRRIPLPGGRPAILSDTVGFISDLPHELVEAFRATLDEVREADLVLHVRDASAADFEAQDDDVRAVLADIGVSAETVGRILEVWNKLDAVPQAARGEVVERSRSAGALAISALSGEGLEALSLRLAAVIDDSPEAVFELGAAEGEALAWLYRHGRVTRRQETNEGVTVTARLDSRALGQFERLRSRDVTA